MARAAKGKNKADKKAPGPTKVETLRHKDRRANIPTEELRDFVAVQESEPATVLYPRDPSLDPQLVWKGKDQQDRQPLEVPAVPIYIQEKIHPQVVIENLRRTAGPGEREPELTLFDDFNGIGFEQLVEFYQHDQNWSGRLAIAAEVPVGRELGYGKLPILLTRMNPDLAMGDELLKKTGAGNLFMVFGEPDILIKEEGGKLTVEIRGLDIYDPTTGQVRSSSTDDIACWFIDTNYNGESFFVRHAYFTGGEEPYERLKRALRADVDEAAWSTLYSTVSRPFDRLETGRIAVKVINHYGDEVLKVYEA